MAALNAAAGEQLQAARASAFGDAGEPSLALSLDFMRGPVDSRIAFTRASAATFFDSAGVLQSAANDVARIDHDPVTLARLGLLIEEQRTNGVRTSAMTGGGVGVAPTYWGVGVPTGVTATILGVFTVAGVPRLRVRFQGTPTQTAPAYITFLAKSSFSALTGLTAGVSTTQSGYLALQAGTWTGVSSIKHFASLSDATTNQVAVFQDAAGTPPGATLTRYAVTRDTPAPGGSTAPYALDDPGFDFLMTNGVAVNFTVDVGLPQVEVGSHASSPILTTGSAGTRAKDFASMSAAGWFDAALPGTVIAETLHTSVPAISFARRLWTLSDGTNLQLIGTARVADSTWVTVQLLAGTAIALTGFTPREQTAGAIDRHAVGFTPSGTYRDAANGAAGGMASGLVFPTGLNTLALGSLPTNGQQMNGYIRRFRYYRAQMQRDEMQKRTV